MSLCFIQLSEISIHAPTRGATFIFPFLPNLYRISIHAPTRGATRYRLYCNLILLFQSTLPREERQRRSSNSHQGKRFQSTLPREERHRQIQQPGSVDAISIHAPTRGATLLLVYLSQKLYYFNPRSHERSDS